MDGHVHVTINKTIYLDPPLNSDMCVHMHLLHDNNYYCTVAQLQKGWKDELLAPG